MVTTAMVVLLLVWDRAPSYPSLRVIEDGPEGGSGRFSVAARFLVSRALTPTRAPT
jgi:hypothetical protein